MKRKIISDIKVKSSGKMKMYGKEKGWRKCNY